LSPASTSQFPDAHSRPETASAIITLDRRVTWASDNWDRFPSWQPADLHGRLLYDLMHPDDRQVATAAQQDLDTGLAAAVLIRMHTPSGEYRLATSGMVDHLPALRALGSSPAVHAHLG
jgi:PAS domain-containing protein